MGFGLRLGLCVADWRDAKQQRWVNLVVLRLDEVAACWFRGFITRVVIGSRRDSRLAVRLWCMAMAMGVVVQGDVGYSNGIFVSFECDDCAKGWKKEIEKKKERGAAVKPDNRVEIVQVGFANPAVFEDDVELWMLVDGFVNWRDINCNVGNGYTSNVTDLVETTLKDREDPRITGTRGRSKSKDVVDSMEARLERMERDVADIGMQLEDEIPSSATLEAAVEDLRGEALGALNSVADTLQQEFQHQLD
ncbi:hypothetical protein F0562_017918 [Nyssa sinensis]|uniref:Uncharacterized protein n=1 Tax=Nyssa sinensis TaxID=561372 RepID=A0A5J4Z9X5_9ASTE|nr:hypothetical protein F0562_017918 [Nyssa sinensis]